MARLVHADISGRYGGWPYASKFEAEALIPLLFNASRFAAADAATADYTLLAGCTKIQGQQGRGLLRLPKIVARMPEIVPRGLEHAIAVVTNDHGPCANFKEGGAVSSGRAHLPRWHGAPDADGPLRKLVMLMNEGSTKNGCFDQARHLTVPTSTAVGAADDDPACARGSGPIGDRTHFIFYSGSGSSRVRQLLAGTAAGDPDFFVPSGRMGREEYLCAMADSVFCLAPRGQAAWSPRIDEALMAGCIPVIIADHYSPPLSAVLNYSTFAVRVDEILAGDAKAGPSITQRVKAALRKISVAERDRLHAGVRAVRTAFRYEDPRHSTGGVVVELLAYQLWRRLGRG